MKSSLSKSLYLGLAALSFGAVATVATTSTASAKSYATAGAYQSLTTAATSRNVESTGTNALYTKPGTVKGAKVVASKAKMATFASSKSSANYFRAYGVKTTNRGSVYYRVVSMDGKYRGYIYGGKSTSDFAGGIKSASTTTSATMPTQTKNYYLKDTTKNTIWTAPKYTQYKASKVSLYNSAKADKFTVDQAATKTREGSLYYHVTDTSNSAITGWIYAGGLTTTAPSATATSSNSVTVKYVDANYSAVGSAQTWVTSTSDTTEGAALGTSDLSSLNSYITSNVPSGYTVTDSSLTSAKYGSTIQVKVAKAATSKVTFKSEGSSTTDTATITAASLADKAFPSLTTTEQEVFTGDADDTIDISTASVFTSGKLNTLTGATQTDSDGNKTYKVYTFDATATKTANSNTKYGDGVTAYYTVTTKTGDAPTTSTDTGNTNYVD